MTRLTAAAEAAVFLFPNDQRHRPAFLDLAAADQQRKGTGGIASRPLFYDCRQLLCRKGQRPFDGIIRRKAERVNGACGTHLEKYVKIDKICNKIDFCKMRRKKRICQKEKNTDWTAQA